MKWTLLAIYLATGDAYEIDRLDNASDCVTEWRKAEAAPEIALTDSLVVKRGAVSIRCEPEGVKL